MASTYTAGNATLDIVPSFKGFHRKVDTELRAYNPALQVTADTRAAVREINNVARARPKVEVQVEVARGALKKAEAELAASERNLTAARDASSDAAKRVEIEELKLQETRSKANVKQSQISAGELSVSRARRAAASAINDVRNAEERLVHARSNRGQRESDLFNIGNVVQDAEAAGRSINALGGLFANLGSAAGEAGISGAAGIGKLAGEASGAAGPVGALIALGVGVVLLDLGLQGSHISNQSEVYRLDAAARSRITTVYMTMYFTGGAVDSALTGPAYAAYGWAGASVIGAAMAVGALVVWAVGELRFPIARMRHGA